MADAAQAASAAAAASSSDDFGELPAFDDTDAVQEFQQDGAVQAALAKGTDLRQYAAEVEASLRAVERESVNDYIKESESLAGLHKQIRECDGVLDSMESVLRGFQGDLSSISAQIKSLQEESLSMNVKLRNRKAAETQLSSFITQIVVPPEMINSICEAEVNEAYLEYVVELNKKVLFSKQPSTAMTSACADIKPELEKLEMKAVQKIRDFMLGRVKTLQKKMTNVQILQQSVLLKHKGLYRFLQERAPAAAAEVKEAYSATMSAIYLRHVKMYLAGLMRLRVEARRTHAQHTPPYARPPAHPAAARAITPLSRARSPRRTTCSGSRSGARSRRRRSSAPSRPPRAATARTRWASGWASSRRSRTRRRCRCSCSRRARRSTMSRSSARCPRCCSTR